jgi:DNA repair exonuclease SbcCD ATPase subunit
MKTMKRQLIDLIDKQADMLDRLLDKLDDAAEELHDKERDLGLLRSYSKGLEKINDNSTALYEKMYEELQDWKAIAIHYQGVKYDIEKAIADFIDVNSSSPQSSKLIRKLEEVLVEYVKEDTTYVVRGNGEFASTDENADCTECRTDNW